MADLPRRSGVQAFDPRREAVSFFVPAATTRLRPLIAATLTTTPPSLDGRLETELRDNDTQDVFLVHMDPRMDAVSSVIAGVQLIERLSDENNGISRARSVWNTGWFWNCVCKLTYNGEV